MYGFYEGGESLYCARASAKSDAGISLPEILVEAIPWLLTLTRLTRY